MFKSNFNFRGLPVDLTTIVINNTLGVFSSRPFRKRAKRKATSSFHKRPHQPESQHNRSRTRTTIPSFLLNRDDNSTPSFLSSLKVLLRHRKYIIPYCKIVESQLKRKTCASHFSQLSFAKYRNFNRFPFQFDDGFTN